MWLLQHTPASESCATLQEFDALLPGVGDEAAATESFLRERRRLQRLRADVLRHTDL